MKVLHEKLDAHSDPRGLVWNPIGEEELPAQGGCHAVVTNPGFIRGNHYHKVGAEIIAIPGPALVRYRDENGVHSIDLDTGELVRFTFPPGCPHAVLNTGSTPNFIVAFNTKPWDPDDPDTFPEVLIEEEE